MSELNANTLQVIQNAFPWEIFGSVESHVLGEVGQTILIVILEDSPNVVHYVKLGTLLWFTVAANVVLHAVVQLSDDNFTVNRHRAAPVNGWLLSKQQETSQYEK